MILIADITNRCNLRCTTCYYYREKYPINELIDEQWLKIFTEAKDNGSLIASYVGGEPMLRYLLLKKLTQIMPINFIVTNGLLPLNGMNAQFIVSVDGTKKYHDAIRGRGTYEKIQKNITEDCIIAMTITEQNKVCIKDFYNEWKTKVKGIRFGFYSPFSLKDRQAVSNKNEIIEELKCMDILNSENELEMWKEENIQKVRDNCPTRTGNVSRLDCLGKRKACINKLCSANYCVLYSSLKVVV